MTMNPSSRPFAVALGCIIAIAVPGSVGAGSAVGATKYRCAATERVVNGGKPPAFVKRMFSPFRSSRRKVAAPEWLRKLACEKRHVFTSGYLPYSLDLHQGRSIPSPEGKGHDRWLIVPGARGVMLATAPNDFVIFSRCYIERGRVIFTWRQPALTFTDLPVTAMGIATDDVRDIALERKDDDGTVHTTGETSPTHNAFKFTAPHGATQMTMHRVDKPSPTFNFAGNYELYDGCPQEPTA